ncbi:MAG TPA: RNA methyltransferase [Streptosporangiaceae bacterium]|nr:RNA methyltransferase [Streptosporangiaceae bacterium]
MAEIVLVTDAGDPRLADYVRLTDMNLRKSLEAAHGLFVAEGEKVIRRALAAGYPPRSVLITARRLAALADLLDACAAPAYVVPDQVAERLTGFPVHRGVLASMERLSGRLVSEVVAGARRILVLEDMVDHGNVGSSIRHTKPARRILVLEDIVDHGNVGGLFRCAAALGVDGVILSPRCADPLYRRAVKVSMGAVFAVPYARMTDWYGGLAELRAAGFRLLALTPDQSAAPIDKIPAAGRVALMLGTEGDGLSSRWSHEADETVCIPMDEGALAAGVDSLNVVAAAAIACHSLTR